MNMPDAKPTRPTLVFVHGAQSSGATWLPVIKHLRPLLPEMQMLALDLPGHGRNTEPLVGSIEALADWLSEWLKQKASTPLHLAGHSMGSLVVLELASRWPGRFASVSLLGTASPMGVNEALLSQARDNPAQAIDLVAKYSFAPANAQRPDPDALTPGSTLIESSVRAMHEQSLQCIANDLVACNRYQGGAAAAEKLLCPVLVLYGALDKMTSPKSATALANTMTNAQLRTIDNVGHAMMAEAPEHVASRLADFLRG
jgi:pimeloyl-ACP methyl ester carboxylesterase